MAVDVLQTKQDIETARARLEERGLSCLGVQFGPSPSTWQRLRGRTRAQVGDRVKSWDVLRTAEFLERSLPKTARVLDLGAFSSEILCVLHRLGFSQLTGLDLNPGIGAMPFGESIRWQAGNFLSAPFPDRSFDAITSISVIEHGFDPDALLVEVARLLEPGGFFTVSFDYWPEKIDTSNTKFFGMDWRIFSRDEVLALVTQAADHGLVPEGEISLGAGQPTVHCARRDYTFAWVSLRKK